MQKHEYIMQAALMRCYLIAMTIVTLVPERCCVIAMAVQALKLCYMIVIAMAAQASASAKAW